MRIKAAERVSDCFRVYERERVEGEWREIWRAVEGDGGNKGKWY